MRKCKSGWHAGYHGDESLVMTGMEAFFFFFPVFLKSFDDEKWQLRTISGLRNVLSFYCMTVCGVSFPRLVSPLL